MTRRAKLALVVATASTLTSCWQTSYGIPAYQVVQMAFPIMGQMLWCEISGCSASAPEGFSHQTFDGQLLVSAPVAIDVDPEGRVYVAEAPRIYGGVEDNRQHDYWLLDDLASRTVEDRRRYYEKWLATDRIENKQRFTEKADVITVLEDGDGDGIADQRRDLVSFRDMVDGPAAGVLVEGDTLYAAVIPHLWRLRENEDGEVEQTALASGFGVKTSLMGHDLHGLIRGPDGKLYFSLGDRGYSVTTDDGRRLEPALGPGRGAVFRMNLDGSDLEVFATGVRNPQELAFDDHGNLFTGDNNGDGGDRARIVYVVEGGETGWAMPYQTLVGDYVRGPWVEERLWELQHDTQPAWVLPPIAYLGNGPSGFAHYPGLGLPERYENHFFLADYGYTMSRSLIHSFALEPKGAGFEMVDVHPFIESILATDVAFGWDGRIYATSFWQFSEEQTIEVFRYEAARDDPRIARANQLAREGLQGQSTEELVALLSSPDQRIRLKAQFELALRGDPAPFAAVAADPEAALLPRLHAVWGLGQLGAGGLRRAGWGDLSWLAQAPPELRAQAAKVAGEANASWLAPDLIAWLADSGQPPRVRFFAAQSVGALGAPEAIGPLVELVRENADQDVFLRHAAVHALSRSEALDTVAAFANDPDRSVRLAVLLVMRRADDPRVAGFLTDPDPLLVAEAARAIYDRPIPEALPALARMAGTTLPTLGTAPQTDHALQRRVIGAALAQGSAESATALAAHAADPDNPKPMRALALESLGQYTRPGPRDLAMGFYRPLPEQPQEVVAQAFQAWGPALVEGDLGTRALEIALAYDQVPLDDAELEQRMRDPREPVGVRVASLRALSQRESASEALPRATATALASDAPRLRAEARRQLAARDPGAALDSIAQLPPDAPAVERQLAYQTLAALESERAEAMLADAITQLERGEIPADVQLEVIEAADQRPALKGRIEQWRERLPPDPVARRRWASAGGDPERGRLVFDGQGDCRRCHGGGGGHGAGVGPELSGIRQRTTAEQRLRSVIDPQADVMTGYGTLGLTTVTGAVLSGTVLEETDSQLVMESGGEAVAISKEEIASQTEVMSPMPPVALALEPRALRDLMAYLDTL